MPSGGKKREKGRLLTFPTVPRATRQIFLVGKMSLFAGKSVFRLCNADCPADSSPFAENDHNPIQRRILQPASMQRQTIPLSFISVSGIFFLLGFEIYRYFMMLIEVGPNFIE